MDEHTVNQGAAGQPRFWTYGDVTLNASAIESITIATKAPGATAARVYRAIEARMTTGETYTLAEGPQAHTVGMDREKEADDWAQNEKEKIVKELNAFLS